jgi:hypothetical protein
MQNSFGADLGSRVVANNNVSIWATKAIRFELKKRGIQVTIDTNSHPSSLVPTLSGNLIKVYGISYFTYQGDVQFTIDFNMGDTPLLSKMYVGKGSCPEGFLITGEGFGCALSLALEDAARQLAKDVEKILAAGKVTQPPEPEKETNPKPDTVAQAVMKPVRFINFDSICGLNRELVFISGKRKPESLVGYLSGLGTEIESFHAKRLEKNPKEYGDVFVYVEILQDASIATRSWKNTSSRASRQ